MISFFRAVHPQDKYFPGQGLVRRGDKSRVAVSPQIFCWIKTKTAKFTKSADLAALEQGAMGLRAVFHDFQAAPDRDVHDFVHAAGLTVKMHGKDGLGPRSYFFFDFQRIDIVGGGVDINENRHRARPKNRLTCGKIRERCRDHLISPPYPERHQGQEKRVRSRSHADAVPGSEPPREIILKLLHFRPENKMTA